ncbi:MAG: formate dehydrogenase [Thermodesulfobacteriota bacterium]|nr:formate dehydrogenase [Thermodesulfobacteriota bacterium]
MVSWNALTEKAMIDEVRDYVKTLFADGKISGFLALKSHGGGVYPHLFQGADELDDGLSLGDLAEPGDCRYPLASVLMTVLAAEPEMTFGILLRGCDDRALNELLRWNQVKAADRVVRVGMACSPELARAHECRKPFPDDVIVGQKTDPVSCERVREVREKDLQNRLEYWLEEFDRCIKCYGCRNVCPVCFCNVCTLEQDSLIATGDIPPENPMFHLTRAVHMAGRCIDCNLCTEACPAEIPLRTLYKGVAQIIEEEFGYVTGVSSSDKSPLNILGSDPGHTSAND